MLLQYLHKHIPKYVYKCFKLVHIALKLFPVWRDMAAHPCGLLLHNDGGLCRR